jgi:hypothetical protein
MPTIAQIRHHITKQPFADSLLTWFQHRDVRSSDVIFSSYPRSGSTWLRFMLCELLTSQETSFELVDNLLAGIGHHQNIPDLLPNSVRFLKTHEPYRTEYQRSLYLVRDVRDVVISEYAYCKREGFFVGDFDQFFELFLQGRVSRYGFWGDHVQSWLQFASRQPDQVLFIRFEDLRSQTADITKQCLDFLGVERTHAQILQAVENHSLANMQRKEDEAKKIKQGSNGLRFVTDGAVGKGKQQLTAEQMARLVTATQGILTKLGYLEAAPQDKIVQLLPSMQS